MCFGSLTLEHYFALKTHAKIQHKSICYALNTLISDLNLQPNRVILGWRSPPFFSLDLINISVYNVAYKSAVFVTRIYSYQ